MSPCWRKLRTPEKILRGLVAGGDVSPAARIVQRASPPARVRTPCLDDFPVVMIEPNPLHGSHLSRVAWCAALRSAPSLHLDSAYRHDLLPPLDVLRDDRREFFGRAAQGLRPLAQE